MTLNKRQQRHLGHQVGQQHIVMLHDPYPLIYHVESMEPAIQIGTLNIVKNYNEGIELQSYPIIRPLILIDENGEINGSAIISPNIMYNSEDDVKCDWMNICILTPRINIEDLFSLFLEYCYVANTLIQNPADIIEGLIAYGYHIILPRDKEIVINLEPDDSRVVWHTDYPIDSEAVDPRTVTNMWFMASGGGSLGHNIEGLVENAVYYDKLFFAQGLPFPTFKFVTSEPNCDSEIKYINENFTAMLTHTREKYVASTKQG